MRYALLLAMLALFPDRPPAPPKLSADEKALVELCNKAREKEKLPALKTVPLLCLIARKHAENMARQEKMAHVLDGKGVPKRADEAGYDYRSIGENVAYAGSKNPAAPAPPPADIHEQWMKSRPHRANILASKYKEIGIAVARSKKGNIYYAQVFGTLQK